MLTWPIVMAMKASLPDRKLEWGRIKKAEWLLFLGIARNDMMDMGVGLERKKREGYENLHRLYLERKGEWQEEVGDYIRELCFLETWAKNKKDWSFDEAVEYRELTDAVSWVGITGVLYGKDFLSGRRKRVSKLGLEGIREKYRRIREEASQNLGGEERIIKLWFNVIMAGQVMDDRWGEDLDRRYVLPTMATVAEEKRKLRKKEKEYWDKAGRLGLTKGSGVLMKQAIGVAHGLMEGFRKIKNLPWVPNKLKDKARGVFRREIES